MLSQNLMLQVPSIKVPPPAMMIQKRVHFSADENDSQSARHNELTSEMAQDMWYTFKDISGFKKQAKCIIVQRNRQLSQGVTKEISENSLGLERYEPKRDKFRRAAIHYTLQAQNKSKDPNFIGLVAQKCADFARAAAAHQGTKDFAAAYDHSLDTQGKRQQCDSEEYSTEPKAKKQRTACMA